MHSRIGRCAAVACLVLTSWCWGSEESKDSQETEKKPTFYFGAGGLAKTRPYEGADAKVYPVPLVVYEGKRFYMRTVQAGYRLFSAKGLSIGPVMQPRLGGYGEDDSQVLAGMGDRNLSVDGGVGIEALTPVGLFGLSFVTDLLGRHRGQEVEFGYTIKFPFAGLDFYPTAGVRGKSDNLVNYYYGVKPSEARPDRPAFEGEAAIDPFLRLAVRRKVTEHWSLFGAAQYEWLADEITDSPIVNKDHQMTFAAGVLYAW